VSDQSRGSADTLTNYKNELPHENRVASGRGHVNTWARRFTFWSVHRAVVEGSTRPFDLGPNSEEFSVALWRGDTPWVTMG